MMPTQEGEHAWNAELMAFRRKYEPLILATWEGAQIGLALTHIEFPHIDAVIVKAGDKGFCLMLRSAVDVLVKRGIPVEILG